MLSWAKATNNGYDYSKKTVCFTSPPLVVSLRRRGFALIRGIQ